ncbi:dUTP diphosphatase [Halobacillus sp. B23F22_1]|uniref:dUTP diphosphatase n=1 Tax=Halobacillus sp. B23F22_1 TaxID=3459514 RepID=UPI00373EBD0A
MNWDAFYDSQAQLDAHIVKKQNLENTSMVEDKLLALFVEVGELANETRCFKFWSTKPSSDQSVVLEEYVDGLHFILSLGLDLDLRYRSRSFNYTTEKTEAFLDVFTSIEQFKHDKDNRSYQRMFENYLILGQTLGITERDLQKAYEEKNKVNFQRQDQGY